MHNKPCFGRNGVRLLVLCDSVCVTQRLLVLGWRQPILYVRGPARFVLRLRGTFGAKHAPVGVGHDGFRSGCALLTPRRARNPIRRDAGP